MEKINQERVKELFSYQDGKLFWENPTAKWMRKGHLAGSPTSRGYMYTRIDGVGYMIHRLVWLYHKGWIPEIVDHIDGDILNNRIENLRPATRAQNNQNARTRKDNKTGQKGVRWREDQKKWHATIKADKKQYHLGYFVNFEDAKGAYLKASKELHGDYATTRGVK